MNAISKLLLLIFCCSHLGCGVITGTLIDTAIGAATYPLKEYVFLGSYKYDNTWETPYQKIEDRHDNGELLLGVAVSGGGSRSAYFFACVMEQLSKIQVTADSPKSYVDEIDYISSVSGGSLAAAYFCLKYPEAKSTKDQARFYREFKTAMARNFEGRALLHYSIGGAWLLDLCTYYDRGDLMGGVWDRIFFDNATFARLSKVEKRGAPRLVINGTCLTNGLKFVFSNIADERFNQSQYFDNIRNYSLIRYSVTSCHVPFRTVGFQTINSDIQQYPLSKAIVASAAVPGLLGPVTLKDRSKKDQLLNIVDGGVYDNYGVESLMQLVTSYLDRHPGKPAKIIIVDGSGFFKEDKSQTDDYSVAYYADRPIAISWLRTKAYMEYVLQKSREFTNADGVRPYRNLRFELISLYGILPSQQDRQPVVDDAALQKLIRPDIATAEFIENLIAIQTRFSLSSADAAMIENVAKQVTQRLSDRR